MNVNDNSFDFPKEGPRVLIKRWSGNRCPWIADLVSSWNGDLEIGVLESMFPFLPGKGDPENRCFRIGGSKRGSQKRCFRTGVPVSSR